MVTSLACVTRRGSLLNVVHPKHISCKLVKSTHKIIPYAANQSDDQTSNYDSFCLQVKVLSMQADTKFPTPHHLITNLGFRLRPHHRCQVLRDRLGTCANVNIMPVSFYKLVSEDPDCTKLVPSKKLGIGIYVTICTCGHYLPLCNEGQPEWPLWHPTQSDYLCSDGQAHAQTFPPKEDMTSSEHHVMMY